MSLMENGEVYTWGSNKYGQLGLGSNEPSSRPIHVNFKGRANFITKVSAGWNHTLCIEGDEGRVFGFGANESGQLGSGDYENANQPTRCLGLEFRMTEIAAGTKHSLALSSDGKIYASGSNRANELGIPTLKGTNSF